MAAEYRTYRIANMSSLTILNSVTILHFGKAWSHWFEEHQYNVESYAGIEKTAALQPFSSNFIHCIAVQTKVGIDTNKIHKGAAMWPFLFIMEKFAPFTLHMRLASKRNVGTRLSSKTKTTTFTPHPKPLHHLLQSYRTDKIIANTKDKITKSSQPSNMTLAE